MIITCSKLRTEGSCIHKETPQIDVSSSYINNANNLFNTMTECPTGYAMQFWKTQTFGDQATSINFAYTCCAAGSGFRSATVWQEPNTSHFESWEGVYCPHGRGDAGFLDYVQRTTFGSMNGSKVELNKSSGKWCLDATGTCLQGGLFDSPAAQDTWQANPVSNFDGDCVKGQVTQPLPFKKEQLSSHPEIVYFGAEKETESSEEEPFECSPTKSESLPANHPCKAVWEKKITIEQVFDCFDRETWRQESLRHLSSLMHNQKSKTEMREAYSSGACASIPDIQSTAYIPGNILTPGRVCQVQNELVFLNKKFAEGDVFEELEKSLFESSNADCVGTKLGLAKVFCDLHCIKTAIAEGDEDLTSSKQKIYYRKKGRKHKRRQKHSLLQSADAADVSDVDDANATSASFTQGSRSSSAAVVSQRAAVFAQRTGKLLQLRQQAVKAHEDAVLQVKERQRHLTMSTAQQAQEHSARQLLLDLDSTWWSIRSTIDSHLHSVRQFQSVLSDTMTLLEGFSQQCSVKWHDVLKGYDRLSSTETEFQQGLQSMWLEVLPKAGLLSDQLLHGDAFSRLLEFDANSLDVPSIMASSKEEDNSDTLSDCVDAMTSRLQTALSQGFAHQMLLQVRTVFAELASLRDRFHFEGMGDPEDSKLLATRLQQAEEAHETARSILMPKLVQQLATQSCEQEISIENTAGNSPAQTFLQVSQHHQCGHKGKAATKHSKSAHKLRSHASAQTSEVLEEESMNNKIYQPPSLFNPYAGQNEIFDNDPRMGLPQWFQKKKAVAKNLMFEHCPKKQVLLDQKKKETALLASEANNFVKAPCPTGQLVGSWQGLTFNSRCCNEPFCIGCSELDANNVCIKCLSGYVLRKVGNTNDTQCIQCDDEQFFQDAAARTCYNYELDNLCVNGSPPGDNRPFNGLRPEVLVVQSFASWHVKGV